MQESVKVYDPSCIPYRIRELGSARDILIKKSLLPKRARDAKARDSKLAVLPATSLSALKEQAAGLRRAQVMANLAHVITKADGSFEAWSETLPPLLGIPADQVIEGTRNWLALIHPDDRIRFRDAAREARAHGKRADLEFRVWRGDGAWIHVRQVMEPIPGRPDAEGGLRWFNTLQDITKQKQTEERNKSLVRVYSVLSATTTLIISVRDPEELFAQACRIAVEAGGFRSALICMFNPIATKVLPVASTGMDEATLAAIERIMSSPDSASRSMIARAMKDKKAVVANSSESDPQALLRQQHGEAGVRSVAVLPLIVSHEAVGVLALYADKVEFFHDEELKLLRELTSNISFALDHIEQLKKLDYLAYYDSVTGLASHSLFLERLQEKLRLGKSDQNRKAVFVLDIERFKQINDAFGRQAGDQLLKQIAERLVQMGGGDASRFARIGPDRFAVVAGEMDSIEHAGRYTEQRLNETFREAFHIRDNELRISAKVGIALFPDDGEDADALLRNAEAALKKAKRTGERYLFFTQAMTARVTERLSLENKLRQALDKEEFVLHYQPKVSLKTGKLTGAEVLIRWNDPQTGLVPPRQFIPILEETGLIHDVGRWALRKALEDYLRWRAADLPVVRVAVNVSPLQLRHRDFIPEIRQAIGIGSLAGEGLEIEITESLVMEDVKRSIATLQALRDMAITTAIDDFGTGFSSLSYLSKLPVDTLKIDRSFVIDMAAGPQGVSLVSTIIALAHSLKLKVVAEGVETDDQSRLLRLLNCDEMQGYLFSKPVPSQVFETTFLQ